MFDIVLASTPGTSFAPRVSQVLREARMRVVSCEVAPNRPPPVALRVDAAVACAPTGPAMLDVARSVRGALDGPPPVVGVSGGPPVTAPELTQSLPEDVPAPTLVVSVQRAAAAAERRKSRVILRGELDDVGLDGLLASLASRGRSCFVRVHAGTRRAEITLEGGRPLHVRADGIDASRDKQGAIKAIGGWIGASFEVLASEEGAPRSQRDTERPAPPANAGDAGDVALAAAVVNACASYARTWIGPDKAASLLASSLERVRAERPVLDGFTVSAEGFVSIARIDRAKAAIPQAMAAWLMAFFDDAARLDPIRFRRTRFREVLGGLTRLVEQVGWAGALLEGAINKGDEGSVHG
jgi:hypothetical protein